MSDDDGGAAGQEHAQCSFHFELGLGVEVRRGLVEHDHRRIDQKCSGQRHELPLAGGEPAAALPHLGLQALWQCPHPVVDAHRSQHVPHVFLRGFRSTEGDVLPQGSLEEKSVLGNQCDCVDARALGEIAEIGTVEADLPCIGVVETDGELGDRGLPRAGLAHHSEALTGRDFEVDATDHDAIVVVAEGDVVEADRAPHRYCRVVSAGPVRHSRFLVEEPEELGERSHGRLQQVVHVGQVDQWLEEPIEVEQERNDRAKRQRSVDHPQPADDQHRGDGHDPQQSDDREVPRDCPRRSHVGLVVVLVNPSECRCLGSLLGKSLDDPDPGNPLL